MPFGSVRLAWSIFVVLLNVTSPTAAHTRPAELAASLTHAEIDHHASLLHCSEHQSVVVLTESPCFSLSRNLQPTTRSRGRLASQRMRCHVCSKMSGIG